MALGLLGLALVAAVLVTRGVQGFECPAVRVQSLIPDPEDCRLYYHCLPDGRVFIMQCPSGLVFDARRKVCIWDSIAQSCAPDQAVKQTPKPQQAPEQRTPSTNSRTRHQPAKTPSPPPAPKRTNPISQQRRQAKTDDRNHRTSPRRAPSPAAPTAPTTTQAAPTAAPPQTPEMVMETTTTTTLSMNFPKENTGAEGESALRNMKTAGESILGPSRGDESNGPQASTDHQSSSLFPWSQRRHSVYKRSPKDNLAKGGVHCPTGYAYIPDPSSCSSFYHCYNWQPMKKLCPPGLFFDVQMHVCNWQQNVKCFEGDRGESRFTFDKMMRPYKNAPRRTMKTGDSPSQKSEKDRRTTSNMKKAENKKVAATKRPNDNVPMPTVKTGGTSSKKTGNDGRRTSVKKAATTAATTSTSETSTETTSTPTTTTTTRPSTTTAFTTAASTEQFKDSASSFKQSNTLPKFRTAPDTDQEPVTTSMSSSSTSTPPKPSSISTSKPAPLTTSQRAIDQQRRTFDTRYQPVENINPFKLQTSQLKLNQNLTTAQKSADERLPHFNSFLNSPTTPSTSVSSSSPRPTPHLSSWAVTTNLLYNHNASGISTTNATRTKNDSRTNSQTDKSPSSTTVATVGSSLSSTKETNTSSAPLTTRGPLESRNKVDTATASPKRKVGDNSTSASPTNMTTGADQVHENSTALNSLTLSTYSASQSNPELRDSAERHKATSSPASPSTSVPIDVFKFVLHTVTKASVKPSAQAAAIVTKQQTAPSRSVAVTKIPFYAMRNLRVQPITWMNDGSLPMTDGPGKGQRDDSSNRQAVDSYSLSGVSRSASTSYTPSTLLFRKFVRSDHSDSADDVQIEKFMAKVLEVPEITQHVASLDDSQDQSSGKPTSLDEKTRGDNRIKPTEAGNVRDGKLDKKMKKGQPPFDDANLKEGFTTATTYVDMRVSGKVMTDMAASVSIPSETTQERWSRTQTMTMTDSSSAPLSVTRPVDDGSENLTTTDMNMDGFTPQHKSKKGENGKGVSRFSESLKDTAEPISQRKSNKGENGDGISRISKSLKNIAEPMSQHKNKNENSGFFLIPQSLKDGMKFHEVDYPGEARSGVPKIQPLSAHAGWKRPKEDQTVDESHSTPDTGLNAKQSESGEEDLHQAVAGVPASTKATGEETALLKNGTGTAATNFSTDTVQYSTKRNFTNDSVTTPAQKVSVSMASTETTTSPAPSTMASMNRQTAGCNSSRCVAQKTESNMVKMTQNPSQSSTEATTSKSVSTTATTTDPVTSETANINASTLEPGFSTVQEDLLGKDQVEKKDGNRTGLQTKDSNVTRQASSDVSKNDNVNEHSTSLNRNHSKRLTQEKNTSKPDASHIKEVHIKVDTTSSNNKNSIRSQSSPKNHTVLRVSDDSAVNRSTGESSHRPNLFLTTTSTVDPVQSSHQSDGIQNAGIQATEDLTQELQYTGTAKPTSVQGGTSVLHSHSPRTVSTASDVVSAVSSTSEAPHTTSQSLKLTHPVTLNNNSSTTAEADRNQSFSDPAITKEKELLMDASLGENKTRNLTVSTLVVSIQVEEKQNVTFLKAYNISTFSSALNTSLINKTEMLDAAEHETTDLSTKPRTQSTISTNLDDTFVSSTPGENKSVDSMKESQQIPAAHLGQNANSAKETTIHDVDEDRSLHDKEKNVKTFNISESSNSSVADSHQFQTVTETSSTTVDTVGSPSDVSNADSNTGSNNSFKTPQTVAQSSNEGNVTTIRDTTPDSSGRSLGVKETTAANSNLSKNITTTTPGINLLMALKLKLDRKDEQTLQQLNVVDAESETETSTTIQNINAISEQSASTEAAQRTSPLQTAVNKIDYDSLDSLENDRDPEDDYTEDRHPNVTRVEGLKTKTDQEMTTAVENKVSKQSFVSLKDLITWYLKHWKNYSKWQQDWMTSPTTVTF